jgi:predicted lipoprotein with Yx(FWY)xxD motif
LCIRDSGGHGGGAADGQLELWAVQTSLGVVVTDGTGDLIYRSDRDGSAPSASNCTGDCLATWQPVAADLNNPPVLLGVDQNVVGVVSRPDGTNQLTIAGWPVYRHIGTHTDEETQANGTDGVWFAIRPDGGKAAPTAG